MKCLAKKHYKRMVALLIVFCIWLSGCEAVSNAGYDRTQVTEQSYTLDSIPAYSGTPYVTLSDNDPKFSDKDKKRTDAFEFYSDLDALGRCGVAYADICTELMPTEERGEIGQVRPSGWHTVKYDDIDGRYLYNRCHLIGFQLAGENANEKNLITGTRYMNVSGMLPFEDEVADYVRETDHHVLYRVTPVYEGNDLVAQGVQMEAFSVEDAGEGVCFNVFVYNVQPGIGIDYATGDSWEAENTPQSEDSETTYVLNTNTMKFHRSDCSSVAKMAGHNKEYTTEKREALIREGYSPCGICNP